MFSDFIFRSPPNSNPKEAVAAFVLVFRTDYGLAEGEAAVVGRDNSVSQHFELSLEEASLR